MKPMSRVVRNGEVIHDGSIAQYKPKDWIGFSTIAFLKDASFLARTTDLPTLNYCEHLLPYAGMDGDQRLAWGVYGTSSFHKLTYLASQPDVLRAQGAAAVLVLTAFYEIPGAGDLIKAATEDLASAGGFLNLGRVSPTLRQQLRQQMLVALRHRRDASQQLALASMLWGEFIAREPAAIRQWMVGQRSLKAVVHPVRLALPGVPEETLQVASFRLDRRHLKAAEARYFPHIPVTCKMPAG
jgi:hypothetical protein